MSGLYSSILQGPAGSDGTPPELSELQVFYGVAPYIRDEDDRVGLTRNLENILTAGISAGVLRSERECRLAQLLFMAGAGFGYVRGAISERERPDR